MVPPTQHGTSLSSASPMQTALRSHLALEVVAQHHWNTVHAIRRLCKPLAKVETLAVDFEDEENDGYGTDDGYDEDDNDDDVGPIPLAGYEIDSDDHFVPLAESIWNWSD